MNGPGAAPRPSSVKTWKQRVDGLYTKVMAQWFIWGICMAIGLAAAWPALGRKGGIIRAEYSVKYTAVIIIFLCTGMSLKTRVLVNAVTELRAHLVTQAISLGLIPVVGWGIASALNKSSLDKDLIDGLVIATSMPTTVSTNVVFTKAAGGNEALAVVNAVIGNIVGIFITPALLNVYLNRSSTAPFGDVMKELGITVLVPMGVGQLLQFFATNQVQWLQIKINFSKVGNICILFLVWSTFCSTFAEGNQGVGPGSVIVIIVLLEVLLVGFALMCLFICTAPGLQRLLALDRADAVAVAFVGATKTVALGIPMINVLYNKDAKAGILAVPLLVYHASQIFLGGMAVSRIKAWQQQDPNLKACLAVVGSDRGKDDMPAAAAEGSATANVDGSKQACYSDSSRVEGLEVGIEADASQRAASTQQ